MNKARNAVAEAGGNAMRIISADSNEYATTVTAEALKCTWRSWASVAPNLVCSSLWHPFERLSTTGVGSTSVLPSTRRHRMDPILT